MLHCTESNSRSVGYKSIPLQDGQIHTHRWWVKNWHRQAGMHEWTHWNDGHACTVHWWTDTQTYHKVGVSLPVIVISLSDSLHFLTAQLRPPHPPILYILPANICSCWLTAQIVGIQYIYIPLLLCEWHTPHTGWVSTGYVHVYHIPNNLQH